MQRRNPLICPPSIIEWTFYCLHPVRRISKWCKWVTYRSVSLGEKSRNTFSEGLFFLDYGFMPPFYDRRNNRRRKHGIVKHRKQDPYRCCPFTPARHQGFYVLLPVNVFSTPGSTIGKLPAGVIGFYVLRQGYLSSSARRHCSLEDI